MKLLLKHIASLGPVGFLPAPGTIASLCALPLCAYMMYCSVLVQSVVLAGAICATFVICTRLQLKNDPSYVVIDEVVGSLVTFFLITPSWQSLLLGFVLFRFFDITKFGIRGLERLPGAWGIMLDDIAAGILSNIMLRIMICSC